MPKAINVTLFTHFTDLCCLLNNLQMLAGRCSKLEEGDSTTLSQGAHRYAQKKPLSHLWLPSQADTQRARDSPCEDDHEVHYVPAVAEVGAFVKRKAQGDDLNGSLETEYSNKVGLCVILQKDRENQRG